MNMNVTINPENSQPPEEQSIKVKLKIRKALDDSFIVFDHPLLDIAIIPEKMKIIAYPKDDMGDNVYEIQDELFKYLQKKGIIKPESVQGGLVFGAFEATYYENNVSDGKSLDAVLLNIAKFMDRERPYFEFMKTYDEAQNDKFLDPEDDESTELGDVPHKRKKGSNPDNTAYSFYGLSGIWE